MLALAEGVATNFKYILDVTGKPAGNQSVSQSVTSFPATSG